MQMPTSRPGRWLECLRAILPGRQVATQYARGSLCLISLLILFVSDNRILRVQAGADASRAKTAYKKLSMKIHPDKNSCSDAARAMSRATEALRSFTSK
eukprot:scaffold515393_cov39-Prasinocladus_malaysianus.AAC.1